MYRKSLLLLSTVFLLIVLGACNKNSNVNETNENAISNPTPEDILSDDINADIFLMDDTVYINAKDIDWVNEEEHTIGEKVGKIKNQTKESEEFDNFTASKLSTGTEIYELEEKKGSIYIVKLNGEKIPYLGLVEG